MDLIELAEAARITGIKEGTLRQRLNRKLLVGVKIPRNGKLIWALPSEIVASLASDEPKVSAYDQVVAKWQEEQRTGYRRDKPLDEKTIERNNYGLTAFWDYLDGVKPCEQKEVPERRKLLAKEKELSRLTLDNIMLAISKVPRDKPATRGNIYMSTMSLWQSLVFQGVRSELELAKFKAFKPSKNKRPRRGYLNTEKFQEMLVRNNAWYNGRSKYDRILTDILLRLGYYSGMRNSEMCNLFIKDVDFRAKTIFIEKSKNDKDREIGLAPELLDPLKKYLENRPRSKHRNFLLQENGEPLNRRIVSERIGDISEKVGLDITPHDLRRTFITDLLTEGAPTVLVQKIVGHEAISTTQLYDMTSHKDALDLIRNKRGMRQQEEDPVRHFEF